MLRFESLEKEINGFEGNPKNKFMPFPEAPLEQQKEVKKISLKEQGNNFYRNGRYHHAIDAYSRALESTDPSDCISRTILLSNRSQCLLALQKYELVVEDCTKAIECMPTHSKSYFRRGQAFELLGNHEAALNDYQVAAKLEPEAQEIASCIDRLMSFQCSLVRKQERSRRVSERRTQDTEHHHLKREKEFLKKKDCEDLELHKFNSSKVRSDKLEGLIENATLENYTESTTGSKALGGQHPIYNSDRLGAVDFELGKNFGREPFGYIESGRNNASASSSWSSVSSASGAEDENHRVPSTSFSSRGNLNNSHSLSSPASKFNMAGNLLGDKGECTTYPVRLNSPDCMYYLKTGKCNYGSRCKFNHPRRDERLIKALSRRDCFDFLQFGRCPYGKACKYNHPSKAELNELGFKKDEYSLDASKLEAVRKDSSPVNAPGSYAIDLEKAQKASARDGSPYYLSRRQSKTCEGGDAINEHYSGRDVSSMLNGSHRTSTGIIYQDTQHSLYGCENTSSRHSGWGNSVATFPEEISLDSVSILTNNVHEGDLMDHLLDFDVSSSLIDLHQEVDALSLENSESSLSVSYAGGTKCFSPLSATPGHKVNPSPSVDLSSPRFSLEGNSPLLGGFPNVWRLEPSEHIGCDWKYENPRKFSSSSLSSFETSTNDSNSGVSSLSSLSSFSYLQGANQDSSLLQRRSPLERASLSAINANGYETSSSFSSSYWSIPTSKCWETKQ